MTAAKKKMKLKNPLVIILAVILAFVAVGSSFSGCLHLTSDRIIVAVDAAYGGEQTGYTGLINESDYAEGVVNALCTRLQEDSRFITVRTHEAGTSRSILNIVKDINEREADMVLSIHAGYDPDPAKSGMHIYAEKPSSAGHERSLAFAESIQQAFAEEREAEIGYMYYEPIAENKFQLKIVPPDDETDYGLDTWTIMEKSLGPAVVSEQIYVSNEADVSAWANEEAYAKSAEMYYQAFCDYYGLRPLPQQEKKQ